MRILSTGRLIEFKGFHHLIMAMARLRDRGVPATLRIIGDGPWRGQLEHWWRNSRSASRYPFRRAFAGCRDGGTRRHDVFALACTVDAKGASDILPTVIAEAMACGLPVVSTRLAGVPEMVVHGETGLLAKPGDVDGLADNLMALHAEPTWPRASATTVAPARRPASRSPSLPANFPTDWTRRAFRFPG